MGRWRHLPWLPATAGADSIHSALDKTQWLTSGGRLAGITMAIFRARESWRHRRLPASSCHPFQATILARRSGPRTPRRDVRDLS